MSKDREKVTFENKIIEAQKLLEKLIDPEITLSSSVEVYKKGMLELEIAQKLLEEAKLEFKELSTKY
jgi:exodeoxyribonuclease VII small subunit